MRVLSSRTGVKLKLNVDGAMDDGGLTGSGATNTVLLGGFAAAMPEREVDDIDAINVDADFDLLRRLNSSVEDGVVAVSPEPKP